MGATDLPSASQLSRETIQINQWSGPRHDHFLSYELRPDNSLTVTHSLLESPEQVVAREVFRLPANVARQVRTKLWPVRPQKLTGVEDLTQPIGCPYILDASSEVVVAFIGPDDRIGIFTLPDAKDCKTREATKARQAVREALRLIPASKVAAEFPNVS